jgi:CRP/FNR family transcriptional regulator, cyclic AMP receptor protein
MMTTTHLTHILDGLTLFDDVPRERLVRLAPAFRARTYDGGEQLLGGADEPPRCLIMVSGAACESRVANDGRVIATALLDPSDVFGQLPFAPTVADSKVDALERCTALSIHTPRFEQLLALEPSLALAVIGGLARRISASDERLASLAFQQVPARLARDLLDLADRYGRVTATGIRIDLRLTHSQLAALVGTTRETLTKVAGWLRDARIAAIERRLIWIADYAALREVAEGGRLMPGRAGRPVLALAGAAKPRLGGAAARTVPR